MSATRLFALSPMGIQYAEMIAYMHLHEYTALEDRLELASLIRVMDNEWLTLMGQKSKSGKSSRAGKKRPGRR